jgi:cation transport ATPase
VLAGVGLSIAAIGVAAAGYLPPVAGALLQEAIDLAVILNAVRVLRAERVRPVVVLLIAVSWAAGVIAGCWRR